MTEVDGRLASLSESAEQLILSGKAVLGEAEVREWLGGLLAFGRSVVCDTPGEASAAAEELGFPVVLKVFAQAALHKSDQGLVMLGLGTAPQVAAAATELLARARSLGFEDARLGVQCQISGVEAAVGIRRDALGAVCMVAAGGTLIELYGDISLGIAPLTRSEANAMVERLKLAKLLHGYRGSEALDVDALVDLLMRVCSLALAVPEISELDLNPVFVRRLGCVVADARVVLANRVTAEDDRDFADLGALLDPQRVALIGAGSDSRKVGGLLLKYLRKYNFAGELLVVNPAAPELDGVSVVPDLRSYAGKVDLACIAVPAKAVGGAVDDCMRAEVPVGIIYSSGFGEAGEDGRLAQERLVEQTKGRFRFLGPNSMGVAVPDDNYFATFGMALEARDIPSGPIGFVSQSGAIASSLFSRSGEFETGFSHWISVGNEADIGVADATAHLAGDERCKVICLFIEVIRDPGSFARAVQLAHNAGKAVVVFKTGLSDAGRAAAASHTGALTGSDEVYSAFFWRHGIVRVSSLEGLFVAAHGVLTAGPVRGRRIGIVSMSGGLCSVLADLCARNELEVPALASSTQHRLSELIPSFGALRNPVDITAVGIQHPHMVRDAVTALRDSDEVDVVLVQLSTNADPAAAEMALDLCQLRETSGPPILVGRLGSSALAPKAMTVYREAGVHVFTWPDQLVQAATAAVTFGRSMASDIEEMEGAVTGRPDRLSQVGD